MCHMGKLSQQLELHARFLWVCVLRGDGHRGLCVIIHCCHKMELAWTRARGSAINSVVKLRRGAASCKGSHPSPLIVALPSPSPSNFTHTLTPAPGDTQGTRLSDKTYWIITMWLLSFFLSFCAARTAVIAAPAAIQECLDIDNQNPPPMWFGSPTVRIPPSLSPARLLLTTSAVENDRQPQPELSCPISAQRPRRMPR